MTACYTNAYLLQQSAQLTLEIGTRQPPRQVGRVGDRECQAHHHSDLLAHSVITEKGSPLVRRLVIPVLLEVLLFLSPPPSGPPDEILPRLNRERRHPGLREGEVIGPEESPPDVGTIGDLQRLRLCRVREHQIGRAHV